MSRVAIIPPPALPLRRGVSTVHGLVLPGLLPVFITAWWWWEKVGAAVVAVAIVLCVGAACRDAEDAVATMMFGVFEWGLFQLGALHLTYPPQDLELLRAGVDAKALFFSYALWGPRFCLGYPATFIRDQFQISLDHGYAILCVAVMAVVALASARAFELYHPELAPNRRGVRAASFLFWGLLLVFMNGRLVNCYLGMVMVLAVQGVALNRGSMGTGLVLAQAGGVYLAMMSSGTMWVALAQFICGDVMVAWLTKSWRHVPWVAVASAAFLPFFQEAQAKNLSYFGGRVTNMLNHGWGAVFHLDDLLTVLLAVGLAVLIGGLLLHAWKRLSHRRADSLLWFNVPVAIMGGAFGYSTGTMIIPAALILICGALLSWWSLRGPTRIHAAPGGSNLQDCWR